MEMELRGVIAAVFVLISFGAKSENVIIFKNYYLYQDKAEILADGATDALGSTIKVGEDVSEGMVFKFSAKNKLIGIIQFPQTKNYLQVLLGAMKSGGGYSPIMTLDMAGIDKPIDILAEGADSNKWIAQLDRRSRRSDLVTIIVKNQDIDASRFSSFKTANHLFNSLKKTAKLTLVAYRDGNVVLAYGVYGEVEALLPRLKD